VGIDGQRTRPAGSGYPRRVRRSRLRTRRALRVFEEMGAALFCAPYFSSVALAANAVLFVGTDEDKSAFLPGIASGKTIATVALTDDSGNWDLARTSMTASAKATVSSDWRGELRHRRQSRLTRLRARAQHQGPLVVRGARRCGRTDPHRIAHDGPDPQAESPGVRRGTWRTGRCEGGALEGLTTMLQVAESALAAEQVAGPSAYSTTPSNTPRLGFSLDDRSVRSRRSSTSARTCCSTSSRRSRPRTTPRGRPRNERRTADRGEPREVLLFRGLFPLRSGEHPDPRWYRFHLGASRPPYFKRAKSSELFLGDPAYHRELLAQRLDI